MKTRWIKPTIKVKTLKLRTLLGENGWLSGTNKGVLAVQVSIN